MSFFLHVKAEGFECADSGSRILLFDFGEESRIEILHKELIELRVLPESLMKKLDGEAEFSIENIEYVTEWCACHRCIAARLILQEALARAKGWNAIGPYLDRTLGVLWGREM